MILYILRHAIAVPRGSPDYEDEDRPLTKDGIRKMKEIAAGMRALKLEFAHIYSSPYLRARQTADIVAKVFGLNVEILKSLIPTVNPQHLVANLVKVQEESVLLVGHEPHLSEFVSVLICGNPDAQIQLKKGGLCRLTSEHLTYGRCAILEWLLAPAQIRRLR